MIFRNRNHKFIVLIFLMIIQSSLSAAADLEAGYRAVRRELEQFYESIYNTRGKDTVISARNRLNHALAEADITVFAETFLEAKADMMMGKHYIIEERSWYDPEFGEPLLRRARDLTESILDKQPRAEVYALASEIRGSLFLLNPVRYVFSHGPAARSLAQKAASADPQNLDVLLLQANQALYTPRLYGGSPAKALDYFLKAMEMFQKNIADGLYPDPVALFTIYSGTGLAVKELGDHGMASLWLSRSLEIYPDNYYILQEFSHLNSEDIP